MKWDTGHCYGAGLCVANQYMPQNREDNEITPGRPPVGCTGGRYMDPACLRWVSCNRTLFPAQIRGQTRLKRIYGQGRSVGQ